MTCTIYMITHIASNKSYIGWTSRDVSIRWKEHKQYSFNFQHNTCYLHNALRKYGIDAFNWEIIQFLDSEDEAKQAEIFWISELNTNVNRGGFGYNETDGGEGNLGYYNQENRKKQSDRVKALGEMHNMRQPAARARQSERMKSLTCNPLHHPDIKPRSVNIYEI
jgi:group I intron endonuclease